MPFTESYGEFLPFLAAAVEASPSIIMLTDAQAQILFVNPAFTAITGYSREEALHLNAASLGTDPSVQASLEATLRERGRWTGEFRNRRKDGTVYWEHAVITAIQNNVGETTHYAKIAEDITTEKVAEQRLQDSAARSAAMLSALPDLVFRLDATGRYLDFHAARESLLYARPQDFIGRRIDETLPPHVAAPCMAATRTACDNPGAVQVVSYELETAEGPGHFEARIVAYTPNEAFAIVRDVTAWKEYESALMLAQRNAEAASRAKSAFIANVSHELRTPLNSIIGFSKLLDDNHFGPLTPRQREFVTNVVSSGQHLLRLVNDVLDVSKIEAGRLTLAPEWTLLPSVVLSARAVAEPLAVQAGVSLETPTPPAIEVFLDPMRIEQALLNLLSNATKFTPRGGRVEVRTALVGGLVEISVTDNGIGIAENDIPRLFREFEQLDSRGTKPDGAGLGLALTKHLIEMHGGTVRVESALGHGSTFT
ncbi:MAG: PAS domain S-box protein, partial [Deltaproteobacteria bacterium]|nr:PAS domain S-box protein [Deltaproteobacteria bacterium]